MTGLSESKSLRYKAKHKIRFVTAASLFDGEEAGFVAGARRFCGISRALLVGRVAWAQL